MIYTTLIISVVIHLTLSYPATKPINQRRVYPRQVGKVNLRNGNMYPIPESILNIDEMVKEVQDLIKSNSSFPRLTRGEIIELIEDISRTELNTLIKERDQKSVMLVMPYTANNVGSKQIEELYTKPPITKLVQDNTKFSNSEIDSLYKQRRRPVVKAPEVDFGLDGTGYQYNPVEQNYVKQRPVQQNEVTLQSYYPNFLEQNVEAGPHYPKVRRVKVPAPRVVPEPTRQTFVPNPNYVAVQRVKSSGYPGAEGLVEPTRQNLGLNPNYVTVKRVKSGVRRVPVESGTPNFDYTTLNRQGVPVVESNQDISEANPNYVTVRRVKVSGNRRVPTTDSFSTGYLNPPDVQQNYVVKRIKVPAKKPELQTYQNFVTQPYYSDIVSHQNFYNGIDLDSAPSVKVEQFAQVNPAKPTIEVPNEERNPEEMKNRDVIPVEEDDLDTVLPKQIRQNIKTLSHYEKNRNGSVKTAIGNAHGHNEPPVQVPLKSNLEQPINKRNPQEEKIKVMETEPEKKIILNLTSTASPSTTPATIPTTAKTTISTTTQPAVTTTTTTTSTSTTEKNDEVKPKYSSRIRQRIRVTPLRSTPVPFSKTELDHSNKGTETENLDNTDFEDAKKSSSAHEHIKNEVKTGNDYEDRKIVMKVPTKSQMKVANLESLFQNLNKNTATDDPINSTEVKITVPEKVFFVNPVKVEVSTTSKSTTAKPEIITFKSFAEEFSTPKQVRRRPVYRPNPSTEISVITKSDTQTQTSIVKRRRRPTLSPTSSPISSTTHSNHKYSGENFSDNDNGIKIITSPNLNTQPYQLQTTMETYEEKQFSPAVSSARPFELAQVTPASLFSNINLPENLKNTLKLLNMDDAINKIPNEIDDETPSPEFQTLPPMPEDFKNIIDSYMIYSPTTTTTTSMPDLSHVANNLDPDMKELLMSFGLLPNPNPVEEPATVDQTVPGLDIAETNPDSYYNFKPLPKGGTIVTDMEEFLGRFGLGRDLKNNRDQKSLSDFKQPKLTKIPSVDLSGIPDSLKDTIKDLGLIDENKQITEENIKTVLGKTEKENSKQINKQTFKPTAPSKEELDKLQNLLGIIKQLDRLNRTIGTSDQTVEDVKSLTKLVGNFNSQNTPLNEQNWAPNPLSEDDLGLTKNEVKRQQSSSTQATVEVTVVTESPNIKGLEESFGGSEEMAQTVTIPPPISSTPNTGFYYLVDWNTFLDIDDQKGKRVNLRLQPKVGDPKKFLSVTVP